jgi:hemolysin activation/secretion protein
VFIKQFEFIGNKVVSSETLLEIAAPYINRKISTMELHELRYKINEYYAGKGYINSGSILPDQKVSEGIIYFRIIEGKLTNIDITGNKRIPSSLLRTHLSSDKELPFNIFDLQEKLQMLQKNPLVERVNGELIPGMELGEASLKTRIVESNPLKTIIKFANDSPPSSGSTGSEVLVQYLNLSGWGDKFSARWKKTRGADDYALSYDFSSRLIGYRLSAFYEYTDSRIIEEPFDLIDITSESASFGLNFMYPLIQNLNQDLFFTFTAEKRSSKTFLFNKPFSFVANSDDGKTDLSIGRLAIDLNIYRPSYVFAFRSVISKGIDAFHATNFKSEPDSDFINLMGQLQWSKRFDFIPGDQFIIKASFQISKDPLPSLEKFAIGGHATVRGYRENHLVRDNGLIASIEYRMPVARLPLKGFSTGPQDGIIQLSPFFDWGRSWNRHGSADIISSIGVGIRWDPCKKFHGRIYYGYGLQNTSHGDYDLQDSGVHFLFQWNLF